MEIKDKVIEILAEQALLQPEDIALEMSLAEIGIDSLGLVETIFAIEEAFDVSVPFNANAPAAAQDFDISSVAAIVGGVQALVAQGRAS